MRVLEITAEYEERRHRITKLRAASKLCVEFISIFFFLFVLVKKILVLLHFAFNMICELNYTAGFIDGTFACLCCTSAANSIIVCSSLFIYNLLIK